VGGWEGRVRIREIIWLPEIVEKLEQKHHVLPHEVRELLNNRPRIFFRETGYVEGEHLYEALGRTDAGRYLAVFFIRKPAEKALIISARDMTATERRRYGKK
jgi:uncharacterized DUF497 family protein